MNEQDKRLLELYLRDIRKKRIVVISIIIFFIICILFYGFYIKDNNSSNEIEDYFQENIENDISNTNEVENTIIQENIINEVEETNENINTSVNEEKTNKETNEKTKQNVQTNSNKDNNKNTKEKPANKDFLFTDGYTMENVTQIAQDYLKSSGYAGECIPIKDEDGIYLGMRVTFY